MKSLTLIVTLLITANFNLHAQLVDSLVLRQIREVTSRVQKQYAPDRRTERFEVEVQSRNNELILNIETTKAHAFDEFRSILREEKIDAKVEGQVLPSNELGGRIYGVANLSVGNNRTTPDHTAEMATQTLLGTPVDILKKESGYFLVRTPDRYICWIESAAVKQMAETEFKSWQSSSNIVFN